MNENLDDSLKQGTGTAASVMSAVGKAGYTAGKYGFKILKALIPPQALAILGGVFALSLAVILLMNTANGAMGISMPIIPEGVRVSRTPGIVTTRQDSIDDIEDMMQIINTQQQRDYNALDSRLWVDCINNGYDYDLSRSYLRSEPVIVYEQDQGTNSNAVIGSISLDGSSQLQRSTFYAKPITEYPVSADIVNVQNRYSINEKGLCIFDTGETADLIVAMPSSFGAIGSRFLITGSSGRTITVLKGANIPDQETVGKMGKFASEDTMFYFLGSEELWPSFQSSMSSLLRLGEITKIEMIKSQFSSVTVIQSGSNLKILAAFSVSLGNGELTLVEETGDNGYYDYEGNYYSNYYVDRTYYNNRGDIITDVVIGEGGAIDYKATLSNCLKKYSDNDGRFYFLDYDRNPDGTIHRYEYRYTVIEYEMVYDEARDMWHSVEKEVQKVKYYCRPIAKEKNIYSTSLEAFGLDLEDIYVNSCRWEENESGKMVPIGTSYITNAEAVNQMTRMTSSLLYNTKIGTGVIINSAFSGAFEWPVPSSRYITCPYGYRTGQYEGFHNAIDISCPIGTQVVSPESGTVISTGSDYAGGNYVYIELDNGWAAEFMHLSSFVAQPGQRVARGEVVALSGNSGAWTTGPHLHFMLYDPSIPGWTDPLPYVVSDESEIIKLY